MPPMKQLQLEQAILKVIKHHAALKITAKELEIALQMMIITWGKPIEESRFIIIKVAQALGQAGYQITKHFVTLKAKGLLTITVAGYDSRTGRNIMHYDLTPLLDAINRIERADHE